MKTRYQRRRNQASRLWRKHRRYEKERRKEHNILCRNTFRGKGGPTVDTSMKNVPLMIRILSQVIAALGKTNYQQHQAR